MDEILLKIFVSIFPPTLTDALLYHTSPKRDTSLKDPPEDLEVVECTEGDPKAHKPPLFCVDPGDDRGHADGSGQNHKSDGQPTYPTWESWKWFRHITPPSVSEFNLPHLSKLRKADTIYYD